MRLTVIGCSGSFPGPESAASCYLVEADSGGRTYRLVVDLGSGALGALQRFVSLDAVDAVALSHLHPDHCIDLCGYYVYRKYHPDGPRPPIPVYGPDGTAARLARAYDLPEPPGMSAEFDFRTYPATSFAVGPLTVSVRQVDHPGQAFAVQVEHGGRSIVYSGDTAACPALDEIAKGCDLLLAEASFVETARNPEHLHMTGRQAAETAESAGARRLVITHIPPWHTKHEVMAEASPHYRGPLSLASTGQVYEV
jgi:ribonuclease BN (tRNA processing enzyme)